MTVTGLYQQGTLTLENDTAGVTLGTAASSTAGPSSRTTPPLLLPSSRWSGNTVNGSLYCTGNNPAPGDNGRHQHRQRNRD